jgi:hypothetical protein
MPKQKKGGTIIGAVVSTAGTIVGSTAKMLYKGLTSPVEAYTETKDMVRNIKKPAPSERGFKFYENSIIKLLRSMEVSSTIKNQVVEKVRNGQTIEELSRTKAMLELFNKHGLKGEAADQFFLGGHFRIQDGGTLYNELKALDGAETRFSSHFASTRIEEKGINAGRILPEVLFLTTVENGNTYSHFQVEASPWRQVPKGGFSNYVPELQTLQNIEHIYDSVVYFAAKKVSEFRQNTVYNRSNYGWSPYADNNPITSMSSLPKPLTEPEDELENLLVEEPERGSTYNSEANVSKSIEAEDDDDVSIGYNS